MLNTVERRSEIVKLIESTGNVKVKELAEKFNISTVTIRNDLNDLSRTGLLVRARGGAIASGRLAKELTINEKHKKNHKVKVALGRYTASLIQNDDAIILDSGTTAEEVANHLNDKENLIVMTNGLNIAYQLAPIEGCEVFMIGGQLRKKSMSFYGPDTEKKLEYYNFNKVILGVDGIDLSRGLSTHYEPEAVFNRVMCQSAEQIIVVTDSSKFGRRSLHSIIPITSIDILVTDTNLDKESQDEIHRLGIDLHLVDVG
ncbi:DeoR family transcriptional regulator [Lacimicrobium alkaliphilum]|uniref:DeoR family transcriptional regulator n=2 Tax=Lacimicrobium alkaliphilum TaxID=1526571 RepID=A0ABQ1RGE1_9ALTE|nr:DeoR family transcriptional regulator [Lacimicrobium alkaliphilum]